MAFLAGVARTSAVVFALVAVLAADYEANYVKALDALDRQRWAEAVALLKEAIKEKPRDDNERIHIRATIYVPYIPHYYLGLALFRLNDCQGAVKEWRESESHGVVTRASKELDSLRQNRKVCEDRLQPAVASAAGKAEDALRMAADKSNDVRALAAKPELAGVWQKNVDLGPLAAQADQQLATARTRLDGGKKSLDLGEIEASRGLAAAAAASLDKVRQNGDAEVRRLAALNAPTEKPPAPPSPSPAPPPQAPPQRTATPTPELLRAAARNYFDGQYGTAISLLKSASYDSGAAAVQSRLFHSAAAFALYVSSGQRDKALLQEAQAQARDCKRLDAACAPDPEWFSPRFVQFFRSAQSR
jgi:tetratricopeptide (TPR) repeat protein